MNTADTIEKMMRHIIDRTLEELCSDRLDDTEYIRNIKSFFFATEDFLQANAENFSNPEDIKRALYDYAKDAWLNHRVNRQAKNKTTSDETEDLLDPEYLYYYYDYIYDRGVYPL